MLYDALDTDLHKLSLDVKSLATKVHSETCAQDEQYYHMPADAISKGVAQYSSYVVAISDALSAMTWHGIPAGAAAAPAKAEEADCDTDDCHGKGAGGLLLELLKYYMPFAENQLDSALWTRTACACKALVQDLQKNVQWSGPVTGYHCTGDHGMWNDAAHSQKALAQTESVCAMLCAA